MPTASSTTTSRRGVASPARQASTAERDDRIKAHLDLVREMARSVRARSIGRGVALDDLVAYGAEGLLDAAASFDATRGVPFIAFARHRIRGAIIDGIRAQCWFRRRAHGDAEIARGRDFGGAENLSRLLGRPAIVRVGNGSHASEDLAFEIAEAGQGMRWNGRRMVLPPLVEENTLGLLAAQQLRVLPVRERRLLELCYYQGKTLTEAAHELGFRRSWASRLHRRALARLRAAIEKSIPSPYRHKGLGEMAIPAPAGGSVIDVARSPAGRRR
jgi:RNA polymerase sigma factor for flagellar operon FliA